GNNAEQTHIFDHATGVLSILELALQSPLAHREGEIGADLFIAIVMLEFQISDVLVQLLHISARLCLQKYIPRRIAPLIHNLFYILTGIVECGDKIKLESRIAGNILNNSGHFKIIITVIQPDYFVYRVIISE